MADTTEQLIELMLSLKKTTPTAARGILNSTPPQIAQSLIKLMVTMDAVNFDVFQNTLTEYSKAQIAHAAPAMPPAPVPAPTPLTYPDTRSRPSNYQQQPPPSHNGRSSYGYPPAQSSAPAPSVYPPPPSAAAPNGHAPSGVPQQSVLNTIAAMPEDQRTMILQVLQMTPEQVNMLGPAERAGIIQLRSSLGVST